MAPASSNVDVNGVAATEAQGAPSPPISPTHSMYADAEDQQGFFTASLDALQDGRKRKILDLIDELRHLGLNRALELPQIVVSGDQSAGKSSVLEAISEIPFPRGDDFTTRFATEIVLRRHNTASIKVRIHADKDRPEEQRQSLEKFSESMDDFTELPSIINRALAEMNMFREQGADPAAIKKDVLSVEIWGPKHPHLFVPSERGDCIG